HLLPPPPPHSLPFPYTPLFRSPATLTTSTADGAFVTLASSDPFVASVVSGVSVLAGATTGSAEAIVTNHAGPVTITGTYVTSASASLMVSGCSFSTPSAATPVTGADLLWLDDAIPAGATVTGGGAFST